MNNEPVKRGKKNRWELNLPIMTYVVADDWIDKLGHETFTLWLRFHTWVDREDELRDYDRIPRSFENIYKKTLGISKSKFYRLIKPLWEYGLIDIIEYEESNRNSTKPKNIIVYEYPLHEIERKYKPLEKLRDWDKDYNSVSKELGKTGGRPRKKDSEEEPEKKPEEVTKKKRKYKLKRVIHNGFKNETVEGFKNETVEGFKNETVTVSKIKPNNYSNIFNNLSNISTNVSNNLLIDDDEEIENEPTGRTINRSLLFSQEDIKQAYQFINRFSVIQLRENFSFDKHFEERLVCYLWKAGISTFYTHEISKMIKKIADYEKSKKGRLNPIRDRALYMVNGLVMNRASSQSEHATYKLNQYKKQKEQEKQQQEQQRSRVPFYNWLEEREEQTEGQLPTT
nr:RepA protein [Cloning vector pGETS109]